MENIEQENRNPQKNKGTRIFVILLAIIALFAVAGCGMLWWKYQKLNSEMSALRRENEEAVEVLQQEVEDASTVKDRIRESLEQGETPLHMLRKIYSDEIVYNTDGIYHFVPIDKRVPLSKLKPDQFQWNEKGELEYLEGGEVVSHKGIDVSKYQGEIDWEAVAEDGVEYAIIRLGYRGYGTGAMQLDDSFKQNIENASKAGINVGVYFFSQAVTNKEAEEEAEFVLKNIKPYKIQCPVVFDTEEVTEEGGRMKNISAEKLTDIAVTFLDRIAQEGYTPMIYANLKWFVANLDIGKLDKYEKWFASYTTPYYFPYEISMWQYTDKGTVNGIAGNVDVNISFREWSKEKDEKR